MKLSVTVLIVLLVSIWTYFVNEDSYMLKNSVLKIEDLPESLIIMQKEVFSWTDYREEYLLSIDPDYLSLILSGREYNKCEPSPDSVSATSLIKAHEVFDISLCFISEDWQGKYGSVKIQANEIKDRLVVIYDVN